MIKKKYIPFIFGFEALLLVAGLVLAVYVYTNRSTQPQTASFDARTLDQLSETLQGNAIIAEGNTISSTFGFTTTYDSKAIKARAQTTDISSTSNQISGMEYEGDELKEERDYSSFIFEAHQPEVNEDTLGTTLIPRLTVGTNIRGTYFTSRESLPEYAGKSKIDIMVQETNARRIAADTGVTASEAVEVSINDVAYKKVVYTTTKKSSIEGFPDFVTSQETYMTVQDGKPYWIDISLLNDLNKDALSVLEPLIGTTNYTSDAAPADDTVIDTEEAENTETQEPASDTFVETSASIFKIPKGSSYVPEPLKDESILDVAIKNQPAVVRVGTARCADIELLSQDGSVALTLKGACGAGVGSGSFVSSDGYVATNGHVTTLSQATILPSYLMALASVEIKSGKPVILTQFLQYLIDTDKLSQSRAAQYLDSLMSRNESAVNALTTINTLIPESSIRYTNDTPSYVIQTSNDPIRFTVGSTGTLKLEYNDTNIAASYVDSNYDENLDLSKGFGTLSDVAILKVEGDNFPTVTLAKASAVSPQDTLTALGFPAFVDGGFMTKQDKTVPSITQGYALEIAKARGSEYTLIDTSVPIAGGNSGGPAFNLDGEQVGLNTYGTSDCADDKCFGRGIARDAQDFTAVLVKNNISLKTEGKTTDTWNEAIIAFKASNYRVAQAKFEESAKLYPANYLAPSLATLAASKVGSVDDKSDEHESSSVLIIIAGVVVGVAIIGTIITIVLVKRRKGQVPPVAAPIAVTPAVPQPQPTVPTTPVAPVQQPYVTPLTQPVQQPTQSTVVTPPAVVTPTPVIPSIAPQPPIAQSPIPPTSTATPPETPATVEPFNPFNNNPS